MSGTNDKKDIFGSKVDRRTAREQQANLAKKKMRNTAILVILAVVLLFAGARFINSNYIRRTLTAVTIGDMNFSATEYEYFFTAAHFEFRTQMIQLTGGMTAGLLPAEWVPLRSQIRDTETGETWADFISRIAIDNMSRLVSLYSAARANGYVLRDESREAMNEYIDLYREDAQMHGMSFNNYLRRVFGRSMNERVFLNVKEFVYTANSFSEFMHESFNYSAEEIEDFYNRNSYSFDNFSYRAFFVRAEDVGFPAEFETPELHEEAVEEAMEEARQIAQQFVDGITTQEDFIEAAFENDPEIFPDADAGTWRMAQGEQIAGAYRTWIWDAARSYGDVTTFETTNGVFVLFFVDRDVNDYYMVEMRQILILPEDVMEFLHQNADGSLNEESFDAAVAQAEIAASMRANTVYDLFVEAGATEEALIELMDEHSDDWTEGGLYVDITKIHGRNKLIPEIEDWLFAPGRQIGDFELIRSEAFGYHLVFLSGFGERVRDVIADTRMREIDHGEWLETLQPPPATMRWAHNLVQV